MYDTVPQDRIATMHLALVGPFLWRIGWTPIVLGKWERRLSVHEFFFSNM